VATPIGNLEDITLRAIRVLGQVELVAAEDTRSARRLLTHLGLRCRTVSYFAGNEAKRTEMLLERLRLGQDVALISESGMPGISDPGERLIRRCAEEGVALELVPGASAALSALVISGLPASRFAFVGFLPRTGGERLRLLQQLQHQVGTVVLYESPRRVGRTLDDLSRHLGDRPAALVRELTKLHQEVVRGPLSLLAQRYSSEAPRGEVTLVVGPGPTAGNGEMPDDLLDEIAARLERGESPRQIADALAAHGRRQVYQRALALRQSTTRQSTTP